MAGPVPPADSLRERKQRRAREAIIEAAHELFAERGFDSVTVTDIAERAEVGRTTFFRYFGDKQEVVFAEDQPMESAAAEAVRGPAGAPIGASLPAALACVRALVVSFAGMLAEHGARYTLHEQLVAQHPELLARSLVKQRRHAYAMAGLLTERGAEPQTAVLAAEIGLACYHAGRAAAGDDPRRLPAAVEAAFDRLAAAVPPDR